VGFFANADNAPITLNGLLLENPFATKDDLVIMISSHYQHALLSQVYKIIGSVDFLGNPVNFVSHLGSGVYDFFHEPLKGIVKSPRDFGAGVVTGTSSLVKNSVYSLFDTVSKLTSTVARVGSAITDDDYVRERAKTQQYKPKHVGEGLALGVRDFGVGIKEGLTGVVKAPIQGAKREGFVGLLKGIGRGVSGVAVKPIIGTVDLVTRTAEGIKNTTKYGDSTLKTRFRPPRHFGYDHLLKVYDLQLATGQEILHLMDDGKYKHEYFMYGVNLKEKEKLLITSASVIIAQEPKTLDFTNRWSTSWYLPKEKVERVFIEDNKIGLAFKVMEKDKPVNKICFLNFERNEQDKLQKIARSIGKNLKIKCEPITPRTIKPSKVLQVESNPLTHPMPGKPIGNAGQQPTTTQTNPVV